jgi:hypothetical protein
MVIVPGDSEGGPKNRHGGADQWLLVVAGTGTAIVSGHGHALKYRRTVLKTLNFYSPSRLFEGRRRIDCRKTMTTPPITLMLKASGDQ